MECPQCHCDLGHHLLPADPIPPDVPALSSQVFPTGERIALWTTFEASKAADTMLSNAILQLEELLESCRRSRVKHRTFMNTHKALVAPSRRLPTEMWAEIFELATVDEDISTLSGHIFLQGAPTAGPMCISQVCSAWRSLSFRTPLIWARVEFQITTSLPVSKLKLLNAFLARSRSSPLRVKVHILNTLDWTMCSRSDLQAVKTLIQELIARSSRWLEVSFKLPSSLYESSLFPVLSAPILHSLSVDTCDPFPETRDWQNIFVAEAPFLQVFRGFNFLETLASFQRMIPWRTLRTLELSPNGMEQSAYGSDEFAFILSTCPHLRTLSIIGDFPVLPGRSITHTALEVLHISSQRPEVLEGIVLPSLLTLQLEKSELLDGSADPLSPFFVASPKIKKLFLRNCPQFSFLDCLPPQNLVTELYLNIIHTRLGMLGSKGYQSLRDLQPHHLPLLETLSLGLSLTAQRPGEDSTGQTLPLVECMQTIVQRFNNADRNVQFKILVHNRRVHELTREAFQSFKDLAIPNVHIEFGTTVSFRSMSLIIE